MALAERSAQNDERGARAIGFRRLPTDAEVRVRLCDRGDKHLSGGCGRSCLVRHRGTSRSRLIIVESSTSR